jgi:LacI family transcriptional regulator
MTINTKHLAKICGVSRGTVDRALHDRPGINPETKERILNAARELGYIPNAVARSLVTGQTMSIGVVVFDLYNRFFAQFLNSVEQRAREHGYITYVTLTEKAPEIERQCLINLTERNVDGIILFSVCKGQEYEEFLRSLHKPIITFGNVISKNWPFVGINDRKGIYDAVKNICKKGYERILYISYPLDKSDHINMYALEERLAGFNEACKDMGIDGKSFNVRNLDLDRIVQEVITNGPKPAILCSSDIYALDILKYFRENRIKVPQEAGLMGFDDIDTLQYVTPSISTVSYHVEGIGKCAVDYLIHSIKQENVPKRTYLEHTVIIRDSL